MEIVSEHVHRVLAYVAALNRHGIRPPHRVVNAFAKDPQQEVSTTHPLAPALRTLSMLQPRTVEVETFCQYMARLQWISDSAEVELTPVGRALLKALNSPVLEETTADVFEIVLNPDNPFAYAEALGVLGSTNHALLVEPYFRLEQLMDISELDNIERVVTGPNLKPRELTVLATGLAAVIDNRPLEIRIAKPLHDRYLIPNGEGAVLMLGVSLGGIGRKVSTLTTLGEAASHALRAVHEDIWNVAEVLEPKQRAALPATTEPAEAKRARKTSAATKQAGGKSASGKSASISQP
jgi:hypothetical protein